MSFWDNDNNDEKVMLAEGTYHAVLFNCEMGTNKKTGAPTIDVTYKLSNNGRLWQKFTFQPSAAKWILWQCGILNVNELVKNKYGKTSDYSELCKQYYEMLSTLVGEAYVELEVKNEEYNGKTYARVKLLDLSSKEAFEACKPRYEKPMSAPSGIDTNEEIPF